MALTIAPAPAQRDYPPVVYGSQPNKKQRDSGNARLLVCHRTVQLSAHRGCRAQRYACGTQRLRRMLRPSCLARAHCAVLGRPRRRQCDVHLQRPAGQSLAFRQLPPRPRRAEGRQGRRPAAAQHRITHHRARHLAHRRGVSTAVYRLRPQSPRTSPEQLRRQSRGHRCGQPAETRRSR